MTTTTKTSAAYRRWVERIESGTFSMSQARQFAKAVAAPASDYVPSGAKTALSESERVELTDKLAVSPVRLTATDDAAGLAWLAKNSRRVFGPDFPLDDVLGHFSHFEYAGEFYAYGEHHYRDRLYADILPVWRVRLSGARSKPGSGWLVYWRCPWQSYQRTDEDRAGWAWTYPPDANRSTASSANGRALDRFHRAHS